MRILLIAYEFPPSPSPQSLRWAYLSRELRALGAEIRVLSVERDGERVRLDLPPGIMVHRTPSGFASGCVDFLKQRYWKGGPGGVSAVATHHEGEPAFAATATGMDLNWKGRLVERLNRVAGRFTYPDTFGQWEGAARWKLKQLLTEWAPDVVVSSHEPPTTLRLGQVASEAGFPWLADLGDPVLSSYTPRRWRRQAARVERLTCRRADHLTVTTEAAKQLLVARHGVGEAKLSVLTQGFDPVAVHTPPAPIPDFDEAKLEIVYTGSFYAFRDCRPLVDAVLASPDVRLTIATRRIPDWVDRLAATNPARLRMVGFLSHREALALQQSADVLVNIANDDPVHLPGKLFEYLGARKAILHIGTGAGHDAVANLLRAHARGIPVVNARDAIAGALARLSDIKRNRTWDTEFRLDNTGLEAYQWRDIALRLYCILRQISGMDREDVRRSDGQRESAG